MAHHVPDLWYIRTTFRARGHATEHLYHETKAIALISPRLLSATKRAKASSKEDLFWIFGGDAVFIHTPAKRAVYALSHLHLDYKLRIWGLGVHHSDVTKLGLRLTM